MPLYLNDINLKDKTLHYVMLLCYRRVLFF